MSLDRHTYDQGDQRDDRRRRSMVATETRQQIVSALAGFPRESARQKAVEAEELRQQFVARFPIGGWPDMPVERYALGEYPEGGSASRWLEFITRPIASISGGSSQKHLIFHSSKGHWWYPSAYGSRDEAWDAIRAGFTQLLALAADERYGELDHIPALGGGRAVTIKLLYLYFPDRFIPVCAKPHIDHFLTALDETPSPDPALANRQLLAVLREVPELDDLSAQELMWFLYHWNDPRSSVRVVKIAPGESAKFWPDCLEHGYICVGWDEVGDLTRFESKEEFREEFRRVRPYNGAEGQVTRKSNELWKLMELEPGDKVVANQGISRVLAVGTVNDVGYVWRDERAEFKHTLGVDWDTSFAGDIAPVRAWATTTVKDIPATTFRKISRGSASTPEEVVDPLYTSLEEAIARRGQVVLFGPPGTGKTYAARRAAVWLLSGGSGEAVAAAALADDEEFARRERELSSGRRAASQVWLMVANPSRWPWSRLFTDREIDFAFGRLKRNYEQVKAGDLVVGYESGSTGRVTAIARVTDEFDPDSPPEQALRLEPVTPVDDGLTYAELRSDPVLTHSEPARFRCQGTLFALSTPEADRLLTLLAERDERVRSVVEPAVPRLTRITFHPSYTYEDFVEGFRPTEVAGGGLALRLTPGVFKRVCDAAAADPTRPYVVVIDEINRGNIPKIFGELITLLELDKRGLAVTLPQSGADFVVPRNVVVIGTMNTADRSIHLLDTALRRRFAFLELMPDGEALDAATAGPLALDAFLDGLNDRVRAIVGREKQLGHALFFRDGTVIGSPEEFAAVFHHEVLPLLQEYFYDDYGALAGVLGPVIDQAVERIVDDANDPTWLTTTLAEHFSANAST